MFKLDQRSSPELYVGELIARFAELEPERVADLRLFAEHVAGGQLEDALIELLGLDPDAALGALARWRGAMARAGVEQATVRRRLESVRRLVTLAERELTDVSLLAATQEKYGGTLGELLAKVLASHEPS